MPEIVQRREQAREAKRLGGAHAFGTVRVERAQRFRRRDAAGEAQLLDVDHLFFHRHGHGHAENREEENPGEGERNREGVAVQDNEGGEGGHERAAGRITRRTGGGLHAIVFEDGHWGFDEADFDEGRPNGVGKDAGGDGHAHAPAGFQADVKIGERKDAAEDRTHEHRAPGKLAHRIAAAAINFLEPLAFDFFRRAGETLDGQFKFSGWFFRRFRLLG